MQRNKFIYRIMVFFLLFAMIFPCMLFSPMSTEKTYALNVSDFTAETATIIAREGPKVKENTAANYIASKGGYEAYMQSLGGVFQKYCGASAYVSNAGDFQEVAQYVCGVMSIFGFDYGNGKKNPHWYDEASRYHSTDSFDYSGGDIDDICKRVLAGNARAATNCNIGADTFMKKASMFGGPGQPTHSNWQDYNSALQSAGNKSGGIVDLITSADDFQVGDMVQFFHGDNYTSWGHVAIVGEKSEYGTYLYDFGSMFITTGRFRHNWNEYGGWASWFAVRPAVDEEGNTLSQSTSSASSSSAKELEIKEPEEIDVSMYSVSTALTAYVNYVVGTNGNEYHPDHRVESPQTAGDAGAYIGYGDPDRGFTSFITSNLTYGASTSTYAAWLDTTEGEDYPYVYARFGRTLADAGLDNTVTASSSQGPRSMVGGLLLVIYALAELIPKLFWITMKILSWLNPFSFLHNVTGMDAYWASLFPEPTGPFTTLMTPMVNFVSTLYSNMFKISWTVVVPLLLAFAIVQVFLLRHRFKTVLGNVLKRIVFLAIGIPICAGLYTSALDSMEEITANKTASTQMVASTLVDFGLWAQEHQLAINANNYDVYVESAPSENESGTTEDDLVGGGVASTMMLRKLRHSAFNLNQMNNGVLRGKIGSMSGSDTHDDMSGNVWAIGGADGGGFAGTNTLTEEAAVPTEIISMIRRYMSGSFYRATDWETSYQSKIQDADTKNSMEEGHSSAMGIAYSNEETVYGMYDATNEVVDWMNRTTDKNDAIWSNTGGGGAHFTTIKWVGKDFTIFHGGQLQGDNSTPASTIKFSGDNVGLSPLSMYNYLSTSFDKNSIVTYSNEKSVSERTKMLHSYTNLIGSGVLRYVFAANLLVVLGILVIIAFSYSIGMAANNIKRFITLVTQLPFAALGIVKSMAQVVVLTCAMIFEIFGTSFMYMFVAQLFTIFATAVERTASDITGFTDATPTAIVSLFGAIGLNAGMVDSRLLLVAGIIFETLFVVFVAKMMMHYRRAFFFVYEKAWCKVDGMLLFEDCAYLKDGLEDAIPYPWDRWRRKTRRLKDGLISVGQNLRPELEVSVSIM